MLKTPYSFSLDIIKPTKIPIMEFYQTDVNTSQMDISITNNDEVVDLTGHTLILNIKKADGTEIQNLATISDAARGIVNVSLTTQSLTTIGECRVQLTIFLGETRKSTHEFKYYVKASMLNAEVPLSSNEYGLLLQLIDDVQEVENILNTSEAERVTNEENRIILFNQLSTLKTELEALQTTLNSLEDDVVESEYAREYNEQQREILKGQLDTLKAELELLQTELNDLNSTVNSNETTRQANEEERIELKGQLEGLKGSLESLENTVNTNEGTRNTTVNNKVSEVDNKIVSYDAVIVDIENRFALLSSSVQQASEVINARTSTLRNKTFVDLNSRIAEIEKDILTSQSTSVVDSVVPFNTLANSLDGATDLTVKGMSLVQLVKNGNFASGVTGWSIIGGTFVANNNVLTTTGNGTSSAIYTYQSQKTIVGNGKKIFIKTKAKVTNANCNNIVLYVNDGTASINAKVQATPTQNQWYDIYGIVTLTSSNNYGIYMYHSYADTTTANGKVMEVQEVMALDLTSLGLDTKTADEINAMLNGYFEGISSVENTVIKSISENLFDKSKVTNGYRFMGGATDGTISDALFCVTDHIKLKPNTSYFVNEKGASVICFYDSNKVLQRSISYNNTTFTTGNNEHYIRMSVALANLNTVILNQGTVAKPYTPYRESKIQLSDYIDAQYFPLRSVSPTVYDEITSGKVYKRIKKVQFTPTSIYGGTNVMIVRMTKTSDMIGYNNSNFGWSLFGTLQEITNTTLWDEVTNIGKYSTRSSSANIDIVHTKGQFTTLQQAIDYYNANPIDFIYQLATPTEITLDRKLNIPIFKNGSIIQEPSKMYSKLSYTFPTNLGRSVESIVNNLTWVKDNQQFIMSYLLDLDTRLTLGGH